MSARQKPRSTPFSYNNNEIACGPKTNYFLTYNNNNNKLLAIITD